jgi:hypothetical protein
VRYKFLNYVVFISFLILKIVVSWVESVKIPAARWLPSNRVQYPLLPLSLSVKALEYFKI